jgi:two-component system, OmpR family, phosphate regulon sensor histidine kinase PhoR
VKNPTPAAISFLAAFLISLILLPGAWLLGIRDWRLLLSFALSFAVTYAVVLAAVKHFIYRKIKLIYKIIYTLKSSKFNQVVSDKLSEDPLGEVMREVQSWAREKGGEMDQAQVMETYRKEFLGNVSHELKTPIFNIQGYIHSLLDGELDDKELTRHFLNKAAKSADRMEHLVKDLLAISELESGSDKLDLETFDVYELIQDIIEALEFKAREKDISLGFKVGCNPPFFVRADKKKIRQVFVNLITNSIKYGKPGTQTLIGLYDMDKNYLIEVSDHGIGIEEEHLSRLFERFYRVDKARARDEGGTGLGLAIVKHIIEAHNQTINVRSTPGIGSTFGVTLSKALDK